MVKKTEKEKTKTKLWRNKLLRILKIFFVISEINEIHK